MRYLNSCQLSQVDTHLKQVVYRFPYKLFFNSLIAELHCIDDECAFHPLPKHAVVHAAGSAVVGRIELCQLPVYYKQNPWFLQLPGDYDLRGKTKSELILSVTAGERLSFNYYGYPVSHGGVAFSSDDPRAFGKVNLARLLCSVPARGKIKVVFMARMWAGLQWKCCFRSRIHAYAGEFFMKIKSWQRLFAPQILSRGQEYYDAELVNICRAEETEIEATVEGTERYHVEIYLRRGQVMEMDCDCPYASDGNNCKHMAAVC